MFKKSKKLLGRTAEGKAGLFTYNKVYDSLMRIFSTFRVQHGKEIYLVGGCCRDMLLGKSPKDYDLTTNATIEEMRAICAEIDLKTFDSGVKHGTLTIIDEFYEMSYEITTYRKDGEYTDGRHPDSVEFGVSLEEDLKRRDFTVNSFAYDLLEHELFALDESYFKDLEYGIIRAVGDPNERFSEDALRMLRALRFMAQLNFSIDANTFEAIKENRQKIALVSSERIRDELTKIVMSDNPQVLELAVVAGLEPYMFNGGTPLADCLNCEHQSPWHYTDVFHHTMDVIKRVPKTFELRWAALFHDLGKPAVKQLKEGTLDHYNYHGHQEVSAEIAYRLMDELKFSNDQKELIHKFVEYHDMDLVSCRNATFKKVLVDIGSEHFIDFIKLKFADAMAHRLINDTKWAIEAVSKLYERFGKTVAESQALTTKDLTVNGYDVMSVGALAGKEIGDCLNWLLDIVLERPEENTRDNLLGKIREFAETRRKIN